MSMITFWRTVTFDRVRYSSWYGQPSGWPDDYHYDEYRYAYITAVNDQDAGEALARMLRFVRPERDSYLPYTVSRRSMSGWAYDSATLSHQ